MKLFFDTETTGKADFKAVLDSSKQPFIVQLAAILCEDNGDEVATMNVIIRPTTWIVSPEVAAIHGISHEKATRVGLDHSAAFVLFDSMLDVADELIAHNVDFDHLIISTEYTRAGHKFPDRPRFCTMHATTNLCKLPNTWGGYKWPKLSEAYKAICGKDLQGAHDALNDVRACKEIYFALPKPN